MRLNGYWQEGRSGVLLPTIAFRARASDGNHGYQIITSA
jgi:hypothetical protein